MKSIEKQGFFLYNDDGDCMNLREVFIRKTEYEGTVEIPKEWYIHTGVLDMKDFYLKFSIDKNANQDDILYLECRGDLILEDARTLDRVSYPISVSMEEKIDEESEICGKFLEKSKNTLDIMAILWENIVLEIPISYTVSDSLEIKENDGWALVGENSEKEMDPRLAPLRELLDREKE